MMMDLSEVLAKKYLERQEARVKLDAANEKNASLKESEEQHDVIKLQTYFGMSLSPCTKTHRLKLFWSILEECIEDRKQFIFQCENEEEANELRIFTWTLVFRINDRWEVLLEELVVKAIPPRTNYVPNGSY
mgnify:CR=1 FL=1|jgi:hypothetical protein|tara:strand:+ start:350 stop:745 length:396 start_codon:yes stop_codon:yes gene_type:complete